MTIKSTTKIFLGFWVLGFTVLTHAGFLDKLKDRAVNQVKRQTENNIEKEMDKRIEALIPSFEQAETAAPNINYEVKPAPGLLAIYTTQTCPYCKKAIAWLKENNIHYQEYDVANDPKGKMDYELLDGRGVPLILVGDERMNGFSASGIEKMIAKAEQKEQQALLEQADAVGETSAVETVTE